MFLATAITVLSGLSPDIRKYSYLEFFNDKNIITDRSFSDSIDEVWKLYYLKTGEEDILKSVSKYLQDENINVDVQRNTIKVIESLSSIFLDNVENDNIYTSSYGTVLIDFEKDENVFSLEIGAKSIGYFSEIDALTNHFCEESFIDNDDDFKLSIGKLNTDFINFYDII